MTGKNTVVIIGSGPAGLTAAYWLLKNSSSFKPIVIESDSSVGGIAKTVEYNGNRMDLGGHRFFTKNDTVLQMWKEILGDRLLKRKRVSRIYYNGYFFKYPLSLSFSTVINLGWRKFMSVGISYLWSLCKKRPEDSLEDFMINRFGYSLYRMFFKSYTYKVWGRFPDKIDASWGKQRIKGLSLKKAVINGLYKYFNVNKQTEVSLIDEFFYPVHGPGELWEAMADYIVSNGGMIMLNSSVESINRSRESFSVEVRRNDSVHSLLCESVFSSMPVKNLCRVLSGVPENIMDIADNLPYRSFITVGVLIPRNKFACLSDDTWIYIQEEHVRMGRIQIFNNWSPALVGNDSFLWLGLEYFCDENDELWSMPDDDFIRMAISELQVLGFAETKDVAEAICYHVPKAYPAYFDSYSKFSDVKSYLKGIPGLYCIGRNGQHRYNNMDHSMLTAIRAVNLLLAQGEEDPWEVNMESLYHEIN